MNRELLLACLVALLFHALLLFGFHLDTIAVPLPMADTTVDVDLVAAPPAPASPAPEAAPPPSPPHPPEVTPPVSPLPPPPEQTRAPEPAPILEAKPTPHPLAKPVHPNASLPKPARSAVSTPSTASAAGARGGLSSPIHPRYNPKPEYPPEARRLGLQGRVLLEVQVGADGRALDVSVKRSSGFPALDSAAVQGVQRWTFEPARVGGLPIASRADVPVNFSLAQ